MKRTIVRRIRKYISIEKIDRAIAEGRVFWSIRKTIKAMLVNFFLGLEESVDLYIGTVYRSMRLKKIPVNNRRIVFWSFQGEYTDNPKYIAEELIKRNLNVELIWIGKKSSLKELDMFPKEISRIYEWWTLEAFEALASAKILVVNSVELFKRPYPKKNGQYIIETWHGSLGIKRFDKEVNRGRAWTKAAELTTDICDFLVSNSSFETKIYRDTFWPSQEVWEVGHPRNDCLLTNTNEDRQRIRTKIFDYLNREDCGEKLFLYAPTFRDEKNFDCYDLNPNELGEALERKFGGKWIGLYRYHPTVRAKSAMAAMVWNNVMDLTMYPDMQDLIQIADVGITDYSSWIFDYMLVGNPGFIYATDIEKYNTERGFVYPLETTPFPIARTNDEMIKNILEFDTEKYEKHRRAFLDEKGCIENGTASRAVVDKIVELLDKQGN